jgi:hypothetical protein
VFGRNVEQENVNRQISISEQDADTNITKTLHDPTKVSLDTQVSAMILEVNRRFLKWEYDVKENALVCREKFGYKEPFQDESLNFLEGDERKLIVQIDGTLSKIKKFADKRNTDISSSFNDFVLNRDSILLTSRATGKAVKVAKSQYVESNATITRPQNFGGQKKFLGLF